MTRYSLVSIMMFAATLWGCGEQPGTGPNDAGSTPTGTSATSALATGSGGINHAQDIKEFELKRSLSGVESLIEDLKAKGSDVSELDAKKKDLEQQLVAFKSG